MIFRCLSVESLLFWGLQLILTVRWSPLVIVDAFPLATTGKTAPDLYRSIKEEKIEHFNYNTNTHHQQRGALVAMDASAINQIGGRILTHGVTTFMMKWKTLSLIPIIAGFVGWFTNYLAVKMIFFPISWTGVNIWRKENQPLGLIGWQGIVPAKTVPMTESMVNATINELLSIEEIIKRLDPERVAEILVPQAPEIIRPVVNELTQDLSPNVRSLVETIATKDGWLQRQISRKFLIQLTLDVQSNIHRLLNLRDCVVSQMLQDRSLLGRLFLKVGKDELQFLTDSGLWFGFLLGILQLLVAIYWDNPWTLSVGGFIVGLATNWLALKWIFEPINPKRVGPFVLQGLFLRRQKEVSADFANFFATRVLTSQQLWLSILTDPTTAPEFSKLFAQNVMEIIKSIPNQGGNLNSNATATLQLASKKATDSMYQLLTNLHPYVDETLNIEETLRIRMSAMTSAQFERVLHPIFEEDELTLILSGGGLGFLAGFLQQLLTSGAYIIPKFHLAESTIRIITSSALIGGCILFFKPRKSLFSFVERLRKRTRKGVRKTSLYLKKAMGNSTYMKFEE